MTVTKEQLSAGIETIRVIADTIRDLGTVPSGELYAHVMEHLTIQQYTKVIDILKRTGLVTESGHLLRWVEPKR